VLIRSKADPVSSRFRLSVREYQISAGKIEGINQKIKTLRRHGYGYPDDEYFFLKLFDMSRQGYVRNVPSHKFSD